METIEVMDAMEVMKGQIKNRPHFIRFIRTFKEVLVIEACEILAVHKRTIQNYETRSVVITDKILDKVIEKFKVTEYAIKVYLEYHEGQTVGTL